MSDLELSSLPGRLRTERERLGYKLNEFAEMMGITRQTQANYEKRSRSPDTDYLEKAAEHGVDVYYVITGTRFTSQPGIRAFLDMGKTLDELVADFLPLLPDSQIDLITDENPREVKASTEKSVAHNISNQPTKNEVVTSAQEDKLGAEYTPAELGDIGEKWWGAVSNLSTAQREAILTLMFNSCIAKFIESNKSQQSLPKHQRSRSLAELLSEAKE